MSVIPVSKPETESTSQQRGTKYVFFFGAGQAEGNGKMKDELGGKGAGLAEMTNAGLPVPPGFTIQSRGRHRAANRGGARASGGVTGPEAGSG